MSLNTPEPAPIPNAGQPVWPLAILDMKEYAGQFSEGTKTAEVAHLIALDACERDSIGIKKYGTPLCVGDGRNALVDAYQESLDLIVYLRKEIEECQGVSQDDDDGLSFAYEDAMSATLLLKTILLRREAKPA